jgi:hypothetical protein
MSKRIVVIMEHVEKAIAELSRELEQTPDVKECLDDFDKN